MRNTHISATIGRWRQKGLILTSKEEGVEIYNRYINSTNCEKCGNEYRSSRDRQMDHSHIINDKYGYFRNILCRSCNCKRCSIPKNNTSGHLNINKDYKNVYKQGFIWVFHATLNGKSKTIKSSIDLEYLKDFAENWKVENKYSV